MKEQKSSQKRAKAKFDMGRKEHGMGHGSFSVCRSGTPWHAATAVCMEVG